MKFREYYSLEQKLIKRVENEKNFSFRKIKALIELKSLSAHAVF